MAQGQVRVPDGTDVRLVVSGTVGTRRDQGGWLVIPDRRPVDLDFLRGLPGDAIAELSLRNVLADSISFLPHLKAGLRRLFLAGTGLSDQALTFIAQLENLTYLQSWDNEFTDDGVQQPIGLQNLESLYLDESSLTAAAFRFTTSLPRLTSLGVQDVDASAGDLLALRGELPGVDVG